MAILLENGTPFVDLQPGVVTATAGEGRLIAAALSRPVPTPNQQCQNIASAANFPEHCNDSKASIETMPLLACADTVHRHASLPKLSPPLTCVVITVHRYESPKKTHNCYLGVPPGHHKAPAADVKSRALTRYVHLFEG